METRKKPTAAYQQFLKDVAVLFAAIDDEQAFKNLIPQIFSNENYLVHRNEQGQTLFQLLHHHRKQNLLNTVFDQAFKRFSVNKRFLQHRSLLHWAVLCAQKTSVLNTALTMHPNDIDFPCPLNFEHPLHAAIEMQQLDAIKFLVDAILNHQAQQGYAVTLMYRLTSYKNYDYEAKDYRSEASERVCEDEVTLAVATGNLAIFEQIMRLKPNLAEKSDALKTAAKNNDPDMFHELIKRGAAVQDKWLHHKQALHYAAEHGNCEMIQLLIQHGAKVDAEIEVDFCEWVKHPFTPLHFAAKNGHFSAARLLMIYGAKPKMGLYWSNFSPLHFAAQHGHTAIAAELLEHGFQVNETIVGNQTPLSLAAQHGHVEMVKLLLSYGADWRIKTRQVLKFENDMPKLCMDVEIIDLTKNPVIRQMIRGYEAFNQQYVGFWIKLAKYRELAQQIKFLIADIEATEAASEAEIADRNRVFKQTNASLQDISFFTNSPRFNANKKTALLTALEVFQQVLELKEPFSVLFRYNALLKHASRTKSLWRHFAVMRQHNTGPNIDKAVRARLQGEFGVPLNAPLWQTYAQFRQLQLLDFLDQEFESNLYVHQPGLTDGEYQSTLQGSLALQDAIMCQDLAYAQTWLPIVGKNTILKIVYDEIDTCQEILSKMSQEIENNSIALCRPDH